MSLSTSPFVQNAIALGRIAADAAIEFHTANARQIVAIRIEEQVLEQVLGGFLGRRLTRTHHAIDLDQRFEARCGRINFERVRDKRTSVEVVDVQGADMFDAGFDQLRDKLFGQLRIRGGHSSRWDGQCGNRARSTGRRRPPDRR